MPSATIKIKHGTTGEEKEFRDTAAFRTFMTKEDDPEWRIVETDHTDTHSLELDRLYTQIKSLEGSLGAAHKATSALSDQHTNFIEKLLGLLAGWSDGTRVVYPPGVNSRKIIEAAMTTSRKTGTSLEKAAIAMLEVFGVEVRDHWGNDEGECDPDY